MKLLFDYEIFSVQKYGGATRYFYELISRFVNYEDLDVILNMGLHINRYKLEDFSSRYYTFKGIRIPHIPKTKLLLIKLQKPFFEKFERKTDYDIFHQTYYADYPKRSDKKRIITVHDFTHEKLPGYFGMLDKTIIAKEKAVYNADGIICISENTKKDLIDLYDVNESKISVIYHGNSLNYEVSKTPFFDKPYILNVGDRRAYKSFRLLVEAFANSEELKQNFHIFCFGGGRFSDKEIELFKGYSIFGKVHQSEGSDEMLAISYKNASVFVYPSLYEGFGIPLLEAMHYGCPVVASNSSSFPEIGGDAVEYFEPGNADDLEDKITLVLNDTDRRRALIKSGYEREKLFSWDRCANDTYNFYNFIFNG